MVPAALTVLSNNVDGLRVYVSGTLLEEWEILLEAQQEEAQADREINGPGRARSPLPPLYGAESVVLNHGSRGYRWLVESADYGAQFQRPKRDGEDRGNFLPAAFVRISAAALWRVGWREAIEELRRWILRLFEPGAIVRVSRLDICLDYQGFSIADIPNSHFVTRADTITRTTETGSDELRQLAAGRSTNVRATIYRKDKELAVSGKQWMQDIWRRRSSGAYREGERVDRLEFQLGSDFLREKGIDTLDDVLHRLGEVWSYCLDWFSLRVPSPADSNRSRWAVHGVWEGFRAFLCGNAPHPADKPKRSEQVAYRVKRHEAAILGHLFTLLLLHDGVDMSRQFDQVLWRFQQQGRDVGKVLDERSRRLPGLRGAAL